MPEQLQGEPTTWSPGLVGFYASCAAVGIGAAIAAIVLVVFSGQSFTPAAAVFGGVLVVVGGFGAWRFLKAARREL